MKKVIEIALVYLVLQVVGSMVGVFIALIFQLVKGGSIELTSASANAFIPSIVIAYVLTLVYLRLRGWLALDRESWSPVSVCTLLLTVVICGSAMLLLELLLSVLSFIPDLMKPTFDIVQQSVLGILCLTILGPIIEELVFRGAVTRVLLEQYSPTKAILISGIVFGIIHINPAQVITATLFGFILAWLYYCTKSLVPGILLHVINNSVSVYLARTYPEDTMLSELLPYYYVWIAASVVLLALSIWTMNQRKC